MVVYNLSLVIIVAAYPVTLFKNYKMVRPGRAIDASQRTAGTLPDTNPTNVVGPSTGSANHSRSIPALPANQLRVYSQGFKVLTMLTVSAVVCWTPISLYYSIGLFLPMNVPAAWQVFSFLFSLQSTLDPIWFAAGLADLRQAQLRMLKCC